LFPGVEAFEELGLVIIQDVIEVVSVSYAVSTLFSLLILGLR